MGDDVPCGELPYLVLLGKTAGFGCQPLTCHHGHHRYTKAGEECSTPRGPLHIVWAYAPGNLHD